MKQFLIILSLFLTPILAITACNAKNKGNGQVQEEKDGDKIQEEKEKQEREAKIKKWKDFYDKTNTIIQDKFKIKHQINLILQGDNCKNCTNTSEKIAQYKELKAEFHNLPEIDNNSFLKDINKIFKTMGLWIMYLNGDDNEKNLATKYKNGKRKLHDIFNGLIGKESTTTINFKNNEINEIFGKWDYKNHSEDTQRKLFEFIEYHHYISREYYRILEKDVIPIKQKIDKNNFYVNLEIHAVELNQYVDQLVKSNVTSDILARKIWLEINK